MRIRWNSPVYIANISVIRFKPTSKKKNKVTGGFFFLYIYVYYLYTTTFWVVIDIDVSIYNNLAWLALFSQPFLYSPAVF